MKNKTEAELWNAYCATNPNAPEHYNVWAFGDSKEMADELASLVLAGTKTATASSYLSYELENEPIPRAGLHNIILNGDGDAVAIVETTSVEVVPFDEVTPEQAYLEGEGDRSLSHWRREHESYFKRYFETIDHDFDPKMRVLFEIFRVVYKK